MEKEPKLPYWTENYPFKKGEKKEPIVIKEDMEIAVTYGTHGHDVFEKIFVSTENITCNDYILPPGTYIIPPGIHCSEEIYYIASGEAVVMNPDTEKCVKVKTGNAVVIPRGTLHQVHNFGEKNLYVFCFIHKLWDKEWTKLSNMMKSNK